MLYQLSYQAPWDQGGGEEGIQVLVCGTGAHYIKYAALVLWNTQFLMVSCNYSTHGSSRRSRWTGRSSYTLLTTISLDTWVARTTSESLVSLLSYKLKEKKLAKRINYNKLTVEIQ